MIKAAKIDVEFIKNVSLDAFEPLKKHYDCYYSMDSVCSIPVAEWTS